VSPRGKLEALEVKYRDHTVLLHPEKSGPLTEKDIPAIEAFRGAFFETTQSISFEFINTERMYQLIPEEPDAALGAFQRGLAMSSGYVPSRYQAHTIYSAHLCPHATES
jgi:hypothetical protein